MTLTAEMVDNYFRQRRRYYTNGKQFTTYGSYRHLAQLKSQGFIDLGWFLDAKEARCFYLQHKETIDFLIS